MLSKMIDYNRLPLNFSIECNHSDENYQISSDPL